jgi:hypothetical protein
MEPSDSLAGVNQHAGGCGQAPGVMSVCKLGTRYALRVIVPEGEINSKPRWLTL